MSAKFRWHCISVWSIVSIENLYSEKFLKLFTIYGHGVHLGHATLGIYTNFRS